ncbi:RnfH family protein [Galenea microaerophila]
MSETKKIPVEVVYALPDKQYLYEMEVPEGTTVEQAIQQSGILEEIPDLNYEKVGIFYKPVKLDTVLKAGDRVEIYRPLIADPKARRRQQAAKTKRRN